MDENVGKQKRNGQRNQSYQGKARAGGMPRRKKGATFGSLERQSSPNYKIDSTTPR